MSRRHSSSARFPFVPAKILALTSYCAIWIPGTVFGQDIVSPSISAAESQDHAAPPAAAVTNAASVAVQKFDDWYFRCAPSGQQSRTCEIAQVAQVMREGKSVNVLTLAIAPAPETTTKGSKKAARSLTLTTLVPLKVALQAGLSIRAEGKPVAKLAYRNCNQTGCWAEQSLEPAMLAAFSKGAIGEASLRLIDGQDINIQFSLKGLKAALSALQGQASK